MKITLEIDAMDAHRILLANGKRIRGSICMKDTSTFLFRAFSEKTPPTVPQSTHSHQTRNAMTTISDQRIRLKINVKKEDWNNLEDIFDKESEESFQFIERFINLEKRL